MKYAVCFLASVLCLSGCNKGPKVDIRNATENQVAQAVEKSRLPGDSMNEPGLWKAEVDIREMNMPGLPAEYAGKMKQQMAMKDSDLNSGCLTSDDIKKRTLFGVDKSCTFDHFTMGEGKIDIQMVCHREDSTQTMNMSGSYTPTSYSMDMAMNATGGGQNGMTMKVHVDSHRVGECTGKES